MLLLLLLFGVIVVVVVVVVVRSQDKAYKLYAWVDYQFPTYLPPAWFH